MFLLFSTGIVTIGEFIIPFPDNGNDVFELKWNYLRKNEREVNLVFIGSSRTFRHIDPELFDSLSLSKTESFNLGAQATFSPEVFYLLDKIIQSDSKIKTVIMELQPVNDIGYQNLYAIKSFYWMNLSNWWMVQKYNWNSSLSSINKFTFGSKYFLSFIYRFYVGKFAMFLNRSSNDEKFLGGLKNGFFSLDLQFDETNIDHEVLAKNKNKLKLNPKLLKARMEIAYQVFNSKSEIIPNQEYLKYLCYYIQKCQEKGIELIYFIPPRLGTYDEIAGLEKQKELNVINLANPVQYEEFYQLEYSFDLGHLNQKGAQLFTKKLWQEFIRRKNN